MTAEGVAYERASAPYGYDRIVVAFGAILNSFCQPCGMPVEIGRVQCDNLHNSLIAGMPRYEIRAPSLFFNLTFPSVSSLSL